MVNRLYVGTTEEQMGMAAATEALDAIAALTRDSKRMVWMFAVAPSQRPMWTALKSHMRQIPWDKIVVLHMDHERGTTGPEGFSGQLRSLIHDDWGVQPAEEHYIDQVKGDVVEGYSRILSEKFLGLPRLVTSGIGAGFEGQGGGHLAFNDDRVDLRHPMFREVEMAPWCRRQQLEEGRFASLDLVPTHAYTVSVWPLLTADRTVCCVKGAIKASAVQRMFTKANQPDVPASFYLGNDHPVSVFLDEPAAAAARADGLLEVFGCPPIVQ